MTERIRFEPEDPENEPSIRIISQGGEMLATRFNTSITHYLGSLALYNYILVDDDPTDRNIQQDIIFSFVDGYEGVEEYMLANDYPHHDNIPETTQAVVDAYEAAMNAYLDTRPDWL